MIRRIALAGVAGAFALGGLAASGIGIAGAKPPTITVATSADVSCTITSKAKIAPSLKNNWVQSAHSGDPEPAVVALPDTKFNTDGPNSVTAKGKSIACTGTVSDSTQGVTAAVTKLKIELLGGNPAVDNPPLQEDNTCTGLLAGTEPEDVAATYDALLSPKLSGAKIGITTINDLAIVAGGGGIIGFELSGGTMTGSLAGGNGKTSAFIDGPTLAAVSAAAPTSTTPTPSKDGARCQPTLKLKTKKGVTSASLKGPKGLKKITVGPNLLNPAEQSSICLRKGSACP